MWLDQDGDNFVITGEKKTLPSKKTSGTLKYIKKDYETKNVYRRAQNYWCENLLQAAIAISDTMQNTINTIAFYLAILLC